MGAGWTGGRGRRPDGTALAWSGRDRARGPPREKVGSARNLAFGSPAISRTLTGPLREKVAFSQTPHERGQEGY